MGAFDNLKWSYGGTFEQLFGSGRGDLNNNFQKEKKICQELCLLCSNENKFLTEDNRMFE